MPRRLVSAGARWGVLLCALLLSAATQASAVPAVAATAVPDPVASDPARPDRAGAGGVDRDGAPVVLVGVPGLLWEDVTP